MGDIYGRKPIFITSMCILMIIVFALLFINNPDWIYFVIFISGILTSGKQFCGYSFLIE